MNICTPALVGSLRGHMGKLILWGQAFARSGCSCFHRCRNMQADGAIRAIQSDDMVRVLLWRTATWWPRGAGAWIVLHRAGPRTTLIGTGGCQHVRGILSLHISQCFVNLLLIFVHCSASLRSQPLELSCVTLGGTMRPSLQNLQCRMVLGLNLH